MASDRRRIRFFGFLDRGRGLRPIAFGLRRPPLDWRVIVPNGTRLPVIINLDLEADEGADAIQARSRVRHPDLEGAGFVSRMGGDAHKATLRCGLGNLSRHEASIGQVAHMGVIFSLKPHDFEG